jgi:NADPH:quinone reductase-like Zn-dependent oxidoreductase
MRSNKVKAIKYQKYGTADVIQMQEIEKPTPKENEVLIKVVETIVTPTDIASRTANPFMIRFFSGLIKPNIIPGSDFAGVVESVGENVTLYKKGDRVYGVADGTHAEYVCQTKDGVITKMSPNIKFEETAGFCDAAMTALTFLRETANIQAGQKLLIIGASGAIGTFAVQLGKHFRAEVTGVCSTANVDFVKSLGAHEVIDYTKEDFSTNIDKYDIVFDAVGKSSFNLCKESMRENGIYLTTVPSMDVMRQMMLPSKIGNKKAKFVATGLIQTKEKLQFLNRLLEAGELKSIVGNRFSFDKIEEAHVYVETGHKIGNALIIIN